MPPVVIESVNELRQRVGALRAGGARIGLVPTMGALHAGHLALVDHAAGLADHVLVTIFVNPTQFGPGEDFERYPRTLDSDLAALAGHDVAGVFVPSLSEMYPLGEATRIRVGGPAVGLESDFRPHFFEGVATVVAKLLLSAQPDVAVFGEKDYQQLLVVRRMVRDLLIPVEVVGVPTVREVDGLAFSSRNAYLSPQERAAAPAIHHALQQAAAAIRAGIDADRATQKARAALEAAGFVVDYVAARNAETLAPLSGPGEPIRLLAAARLGSTRLIDNIGV